MSERAARGSLYGRWAARGDGKPNMLGAITIERDLPAGSKLWLRGSTRQAGGAYSGIEFISIEATLATRGPRKGRARPDVSDEPEGKFRCLEQGGCS